MTLIERTLEAAGPPSPSAAGGQRWSTRLRSRPGSLMVAPALVFVAVVFAYPVLRMFVLSVTNMPAGQASSWYSNYEWYLTSGSQMNILRRTFVISAWITVSCFVLGFPYAYLMTRVGTRARLLMTGAVMLPFWSNLVVRTYAWVILLSDVGPLQAFLRSMGIHAPTLLGNVAGMTIGATQVLLPFFVLPVYAGLQGIDRRLLDAAVSLGASPGRAFRKVYLPLAVPGIMAGSTLVFVLSLGFYFTPALLGSPKQSMISQQIVQQTNALLAFGRGGAMALVLLASTLLILGAAALVTRRHTRALGIGGGR
ncbi:ABC transporter permease [Streptomyces spongiae]|uniref:ABC transporter permease n=1 Tax=Streptomyces spongiae TaxID=565072 RepID=A0A5N8XBW1_9ACTN|nr:ABC transporter permease [Streptomyces spongiae]MPY56398.1 ABC transporter permease [Streptomyces spongiae]